MPTKDMFSSTGETVNYKKGRKYKIPKGDRNPLSSVRNDLGPCDIEAYAIAAKALDFLVAKHPSAAKVDAAFEKLRALAHETGKTIDELDPITKLMCSIRFALPKLEDMIAFMVSFVKESEDAQALIRLMCSPDVTLWEQKSKTRFRYLGPVAELLQDPAKDGLPVCELLVWHALFGVFPDNTGCGNVLESCNAVHWWLSGQRNEQAAREKMLSYYCGDEDVEDDDKDDDLRLSTEDLFVGFCSDLGPESATSVLGDLLRPFGLLWNL